LTTNLSASVLARLLNLAKHRGDDYNLLLNRYALERLLCRVAASAHADRFLLKGALLFSLWYDEPHRPTRDADLLGSGLNDAVSLIATFREIAGIDMDDGIAFDPSSVRADPIREDNRYGGLRVRLNARIGNVRCALQVDVGFGDAVTPAPQSVVFPVLLDGLPAPRLHAYPVYAVIAEKYHAMVILGLANTRMKDFYDLAFIAQRSELDGATLAKAIAATFSRRNTPLPARAPVALTAEFGEDSAKQRQWQAFLRKSRLPATELPSAVTLLYSLLWPATQVAASASSATASWHARQRQWR
jgi:Nucleotidyl transferase AbiEii toxin, Type IV TA system